MNNHETYYNNNKINIQDQKRKSLLNWFQISYYFFKYTNNLVTGIQFYFIHFSNRDNWRMKIVSQ